MLRNRVAQEAALLLYTSQEKEYKQAKRRAAETLGARVLPSNLEVAEELDRIAEEREGAQRRELLLRMRRESARRNSDIDVHTFSQDHIQIVDQLQKHNYTIKSSEWRSVTKDGKKDSSFHVHVLLSSGDGLEVVVRSPDHLGKPERCETYGDVKTGLSLNQLTKILEENPLQKFVPT
jgi:hypothetical protein